MKYAEAATDDEPIFKKPTWCVFSKAALLLGKKLGFNKEYLKENFITFYSGRHFWKTLMNAGGLGEDAEEIFMGHKMSGNVAKLYNHRDKQGQDRIVKKAKQVFAILDNMLFSAYQ